MRALLQRVSSAQVVIDENETRTTGAGLLVLAGFCDTDTEETVKYLADKIINLRIFGDENGALNRSLLDVEGELMVVSQFTLYANCKKGRRPSFIDAAKPDRSIPLYEKLVASLKQSGLPLQTGEFGADMQITLINDGPVTIMLDSADIMPSKGGDFQ